jgi:hypothetical protein
LSAPPDVPLNTPFIWRSEQDNSEIIAMWHPFGYGGHSVTADGTTVELTPPEDCVYTPKFNETAGRDILCFSWRGTNAGPFRDPDEVLQVFAQARAAFPGAKVKASTLETFVDALEPHTGRLPVVTGEIGDTWIHGVASDPIKMKQFRAIMRMRSQCLLSESCTAQARLGSSACSRSHAAQTYQQCISTSAMLEGKAWRHQSNARVSLWGPHVFGNGQSSGQLFVPVL